MEEVDKYMIKSEITREEMAKLWSTKDPLGQDERERAPGLAPQYEPLILQIIHQSIQEGGIN